MLNILQVPHTILSTPVHLCEYLIQYFVLHSQPDSFATLLKVLKIYSFTSFPLVKQTQEVLCYLTCDPFIPYLLHYLTNNRLYYVVFPNVTQ